MKRSLIAVSLSVLLVSCVFNSNEGPDLISPVGTSELLPVVLIWQGEPPFTVVVDGEEVVSDLMSSELELTDLEVGEHTWRVKDRSGWSNTASFEIVETAATLVMYITSSTSGPAVPGVEVVVEDSSALTDDSGVATITFRTSRKFVNVEMHKTGYAWSRVENLKVVPGGTRSYRALVRKPNLTRESTGSMTLLADFFDESGNRLDLDSVGSTFTVLATVSSGIPVHYFYGSLGDIPGAAYMTSPRVLIEDSEVFHATFSTLGFSGETEFHLVVYDYNENRLDRIFYMDISAPSENPKNPYRPEKKHLRAFTTSEEIVFYSAQPDSNTWIELSWVPWIESSSSRTTEEPDGYSVFRRVGGRSEKVGFVPKEFGIFRDHSPVLKPGVSYGYTVCSVYSGIERECTDFGSVSPLEPFRVSLLKPEDMETDVSRDPTFVAIGNELESSEGAVRYNFSVFVLDEIFSSTYFVDATETENGLALIVHEGDEPRFAMKFSEGNWYYLDSSGYYRPYPYKMLEANKSYEWGLVQAHAFVKDEDSESYSLFSDVLFVGLPWRESNRFTTGEDPCSRR